ncbi:hypothetical protein TREMEDRAFT_70997 [Tremella mesenterica DSM 1558]|uniref:uncharacterized protein n=1 Tax=Tremella mesenterica (strain ATCC 24925 / CBS 8224 / DSM 1558 / NBRC 9311 / NRRL Y-6157 / RJB 2259-6 / UBC 559-6) TaxID=578456 RepID=UPI0003F49152|nr:uncharacterized protein TREMEDRAFT_70997 [Tremella mesenterica DSM 1558]EIW73580.1 hypothetical protein TREMEDRAFT_70997 [Tremella mesenterica DSM 1558]
MHPSISLLLALLTLSFISYLLPIIPSHPRLFLTLITFLTSIFFLRSYGLPLYLRYRTQIRFASISLLSAKGLEWRPAHKSGTIVPTVRIEKVCWAWGGRKGDDVGWVVLKFEGIAVRAREGDVLRQGGGGKSHRGPSKLRDGIMWSLGLTINHWAGLSRLLSIQISDFRVIFDDLDGLELTVHDARAGIKVVFESRGEENFLDAAFCTSPTSSPTGGYFSPPISPIRTHPQPSFSDSFSPSRHIISPSISTSAPLPRATRRRSSLLQPRLPPSLTGFWRRLFGRGTGSVSITASVEGLAVILPHFNPPQPVSAKPSMPDLSTRNNGLDHKSSIRSMKEDNRPTVFPSSGGKSILPTTNSRYAITSGDGGFEKLLEVDGRSSAVLGVGFAPNKMLGGEGTLSAAVSIGEVRTSLGALEKVQEMIQERRPEKSPSESPKSGIWAPQGAARIALRSLEFVSLSFARITFCHFLPSARNSAPPSESETSSLQEEDLFQLSLSTSNLHCRLSAADSSNNDRARNAFGHNTSPACRIKGIAYSAGWTSIELQCLAPGEREDERDQLFAVREADFEGLSTWRPRGWSREELLFSSDPNIALLVGKGDIASIDVAGDVQLLTDLVHAWKRSRPREVTPEKVEYVKATKRDFGLPPRMRMVMDIGHAMLVLADRVSEHKTTLALASDGLHLGCFTSFQDIIGRRPDRSSTKEAFRREDELRGRRKEMQGVDYTLPVSMLKPQVRRRHSTTPAKLRDDYSMSMSFEASLALQPMSLHLTLGEKDPKTYHLATVGTAFGTFSGDVLGKHDIDQRGSEKARLEQTSISAAIDLGIESGIKVNMWQPAVLDALVAMGGERRHAEPQQPRLIQSNLLDRLPSGISARLSLGLISIFVGHKDPNPHCSLELIRGLWIQTQATFEFAHYSNRAQALNSRHPLNGPQRAKLRLPDDITTQALAVYYQVSSTGGRAALTSAVLVNFFVKPIWHGQRFTDAGGTSMSHANTRPVQQPQAEDYVGWEFRRPNGGDSAGWAESTNALPPLETTGTDQAQQPLIRIHEGRFTFFFSRATVNAPLSKRCHGKVDSVRIRGDMSHIYASLLAVLTLKKLHKAWRKPHPPSKIPRQHTGLDVEISLPRVLLHIGFPLQEQVFIHMTNSMISKHTDTGIRGRAEAVLVHVPSPMHQGSWDELGRIKELSVVAAPLGEPPEFHIGGEALRIRVPHTYELSKLILNINVSIKSLKLLLLDIFTENPPDGFRTVRIPEAEGPKRVPPLHFSFKHVDIEARDNPIETKLNMIWRVGLVAQKARNELEDEFEKKVRIISQAEAEEFSDDDVSTTINIPSHGSKFSQKLTPKHSVSLDEARYRLDWYKSQKWIHRISSAREEQKRRETEAVRPFQIPHVSSRLPISVVGPVWEAPLFRSTFEDFKMSITQPNMNREEIIEYMGECSAPFHPDTQFTLMVPLQINWTMSHAEWRLRDYPLSVIKIPRLEDNSPAWHVESPFIIAEELAGEDSITLVPTPVIPAGLGDTNAKPFQLQIAKTIMPVKTYARPEVHVMSKNTTEFTWGNSYQPAIQDLTRVIETLSHPPRDPSPKIGFWDKFRLILHWTVRIRFDGIVHLHLKGSRDPYYIEGLGAGFALAWRGNTRLEIGHANPQFELIQISADSLMIAIPDLSALRDDTLVGAEGPEASAPVPPNADHTSLINRRYTKPCARFNNGTRVGFGFRFERTCRPWSCDKCGSTENLMHRQCRIFDFKQHQEVILRSEEAIKEDERRHGHSVDSYEGFRSDYIHFSVSLVNSTGDQLAPDSLNIDKDNSLHLSPKAFAHFFAWWRLFDHTLSLPIRQGSLFPNFPTQSKSFGRSLGTIKYRFDLSPLYLSHVYSQMRKDLWTLGMSECLGIKARFGRFRADAHQRAQEKTVHHEQLNRTIVVTHKPFYAADLLLDDIEVKGLRAHFEEAWKRRGPDEVISNLPKVSEMDVTKKGWYSFFDYVDADRKPLDKDPRLDVVELGDCPQVFFSKRVKAKPSSPHEDNGTNGMASESHQEMENTKFGHEKSHICYLGAAEGVGPTQRRIVSMRIRHLEREIQDLLDLENTPEKKSAELRNQTIQRSLKALKRHFEELQKEEKRRMDDNTFEAAYKQGVINGYPQSQQEQEAPFENTFHVHCPRISWTNESRNILFGWYFSSRDRKREEYTVSHASLRGVRDGLRRRLNRPKNGLNQDDIDVEIYPVPAQMAGVMVDGLEKRLRDPKACRNQFRLPVTHQHDHEDIRKPSIGLPTECTVKPKNRILLLKPQVALKSNVDTESMILLALEEISFKAYDIVDENAMDLVTAEVMARQYVSMKGLQAFYPNSEMMERERSMDGIPKGLDFLPLEIFLDVKSEATDYDRIVLKTDAAMSLDRFNHLRVPRGLEWPEAMDDAGEPIHHLRLHQDLTTVIVPRLVLSATSQHYSALYNVVTDLLMYQDPAHRRRSQRVDEFLLQFDRRDRDPSTFLVELFNLQREIRELEEKHRGYEQNIDRIDDVGRQTLVQIRADHLEYMDHLFTVFDAISVNFAKDDARAMLKASSRFEVRAGGIAWHMLQDTFQPLIKLDIEHTLLSYLRNKDGSTDLAIAVGDLAALNSNADVLYPEVFAVHGNGTGSGFFSTNVSTLSLPSQMPPLSRSHSEVSIASQKSGTASIHSIRSNSSGEDSKNKAFPLTSNLRDAQEMRRRASSIKTFERIVFGNTAFILDFKGDGKRRKLGIPLPDVVGFQVRTPDCVYLRKLWTYEDVFEHVKRDVRAHLWAQSGDLLSQILRNTSLLRSKKGLQSMTPLHKLTNGTSGSTNTRESKLRYHLEPSLSSEGMEGDSSGQSSGGLSKLGSRLTIEGSEISRAISKSSGLDVSPIKRHNNMPLDPLSPQSQPSLRSKSPFTPGRDSVEDEEDERDVSLGKEVGRKMKGFLHKLRPRRASESVNVSGDEVSQTSFFFYGFLF